MLNINHLKFPIKRQRLQEIKKQESTIFLKRHTLNIKKQKTEKN